MIRPLMPMMTLSELHTVMTNGFATVAGSTLAVYILYGVSQLHATSEEFSMHIGQLNACRQHQIIKHVLKSFQ